MVKRLLFVSILVASCTNKYLLSGTEGTAPHVALKIEINDTSLAHFDTLVYHRLKNDLLMYEKKRRYKFIEDSDIQNANVIKVHVSNAVYLDSAMQLSLNLARESILHKNRAINDSISMNSFQFSESGRLITNAAVNAITLPLGVFVYIDDTDPAYVRLSKEEKALLKKYESKVSVTYHAEIINVNNETTWIHDTTLSAKLYRQESYENQKVRIISNLQNDLRFKIPLFQ